MAELADPTVVPAPEVFSRHSSGLVRSVSTLNLIYYGAMAITLGYAIFTINAWPSYPGASMELATGLCALGAIAVAFVYALLASIYPRSGGEYVFLTRTLHPSIGFTLSFVEVFWYIFYIGVTGAFFCIYGLAPLFGVVGLQTGSHALTDIGTWFAGKTGIFLGGSALVVVIGLMVYRGMGGYFKAQRWSSAIALASYLAAIVVLVLGTTGTLSFAHHFNNLAGAGAYRHVTAGVSVPAFSFSSTLNFMIWPAFSIIFSVNMVAFSGEIKNVRWGPLIGMIGSMVIIAVLFIGLMALGRGALGDRFMLAAPGDTHFPLAVAPYLQSMTGILGGSWVLTVFVSFWVLFTIPFAAGANFIYCSRAMLAWSLDGLAPASFGVVSKTRHSPVWSIVLLTVLGEIALAVYAFTTLVTTISGLIGYVAAFFVVCLLGIVFPYWKRALFEASPSAIRILGIPVMTIGGVIGSVFIGFLIYRTIVDKVYGASTGVSLWSTLGAIVVGFVWYFAVRRYRETRGTVTAQPFRELPIE